MTLDSTPDSAGWIEWRGGECPVGPQAKVRVRYNCGEVSKWLAAKFFPWSWRADAPGYNVRAYQAKGLARALLGSEGRDDG